MSTTHKSYIRPETEMLDIIYENYSMLLMLEHFEIDFSVGDSTAQELCQEYHIDLQAFLAIANLYNGYYPGKADILPTESLTSIVCFLKNSHKFYKEDKYPELMHYIQELKKTCKSSDMRLVEDFFTDYFNEVSEHLDYEDKIAFPFFMKLSDNNIETNNKDFSAFEYSDHHGDIETKLEDLKNLLLKHIKMDKNLSTRRKFLNGLLGLEFDLKIHSFIEDMILVPIVEQIEKQKK